MAAARSCLTIVLAAGEGTRMRSSLPKVLHKVAGLPMIGHVTQAAVAAGSDRIAVVVGPQAQAVAKAATALAPGATVHEQTDRLGTAHAVLAARAAVEEGADDILVVFADTPLVTSATLARLRAGLSDGAAVAVLGFEAADPTGYGRLLVEGGTLVAIREEKDASPAERRVTFCNGGLMALSGAHALALLEGIGNANAKGEYYLTDAVALAHARGLKAVAIAVPEDEVRGVNTRGQLAEAEAVMQARLRAHWMAEGVTMHDPARVYLSADTRLARDVVLEPDVVFGPGVTVAEGVEIRAFSHLEGVSIDRGARIGPFARLRPGAAIGPDAHIGNFVEIKAASVEAGAKVNHLTYIGDARVGAGANVGAGTITCNYDGFGKYHTDIGAGAFVGSNSSLVAPLRIGERAYIGSGSVITRDVPADALAVARGRQEVKPGWAASFRAKMEAVRAARKAKG
jgi:bifunctional UDP-N-acetylglucosamine pyrophosphorylase/glucosamine-1-phosphate N-acetyltransferase